MQCTDSAADNMTRLNDAAPAPTLMRLGKVLGGAMRGFLSSRRAVACLTALLVVLGLGATSCAPAVRVAAAAVGEIGADAFIGEVLGHDEAGVEAVTSGGTRSGGTAGLYGGSLHKSRCDKAGLARFLTDPRN